MASGEFDERRGATDAVLTDDYPTHDEWALFAGVARLRVALP
jgi:hypothetical protein